MSLPAAEMLWICCSIEAKIMLIAEGGRFYHWTHIAAHPDTETALKVLQWFTASEWSLIFIPIWLQMPGQQKCNWFTLLV